MGERPKLYAYCMCRSSPFYSTVNKTSPMTIVKEVREGKWTREALDFEVEVELCGCGSPVVVGFELLGKTGLLY